MVKHLATLENLVSLNVSRTGFKREWLLHLSTLKNLKRMFIGRNGLVDDDFQELRKHLPDCRIWA